MISSKKYEELVKSIIDRVGNSYYNEENYVHILNEIVNKFAEERINRILNNSFLPKDIDITEMFDTFKNRLVQPEWNNSDFAFCIRHILQTWDSFYLGFIDTKTPTEIIDICKKNYNLNINLSDVKDYYTARNTIHLNNDLLEKYKQLFKVYLTIDETVYSSKDVQNISKPLIKKLIEIGLTLTRKHKKISMRDIIISYELIILRKICDSSIINSKNRYGNFIEELYMFNSMINKENPKFYLHKFYTNNDLWALTLLSIFFHRTRDLGESPYSDPLEIINLLINLDWEKDIIISHHGTKIDKSEIYDELSDLYKEWNNDYYLYEWDNFWNDEFKNYYIKRITSIEKLKINEFISASNQKPELPITKKQKISKKITEEVLLYFANYCERHREDTFKEIEEIVIEHFQYKFAETTLRNWLNNNCRHCDVVKGKTPTEIIKIITVDIAEKWYKYFLKAKGR